MRVLSFLLIFVANITMADNHSFIEGSMICNVDYHKVTSIASGSSVELPLTEGEIGNSNLLEFQFFNLPPNDFFNMTLVDGDHVITGAIFKNASVERSSDKMEKAVVIKPQQKDAFLGEVALYPTVISIRSSPFTFFTDHLVLSWKSDNQWVGLYTKIRAGTMTVTTAALKCRDVSRIYPEFHALFYDRLN